MQIKDDRVIFSTGKILYANCGVIGLGPKADYATEGWDGSFEGQDEEEEENYLTQPERVELADYMIALWGKYKVTDRTL